MMEKCKLRNVGFWLEKINQSYFQIQWVICSQLLNLPSEKSKPARFLSRNRRCCAFLFQCWVSHSAGWWSRRCHSHCSSASRSAPAPLWSSCTATLHYLLAVSAVLSCEGKHNGLKQFSSLGLKCKNQRNNNKQIIGLLRPPISWPLMGVYCSNNKLKHWFFFSHHNLRIHHKHTIWTKVQIFLCKLNQSALYKSN